MKRFLLSLLVVFVTVGTCAQVTVFTDNFNSSTGASYTAATGPIGSSSTWSLTLSGADWGAKIDNNILDLTNDASGAANLNGWCFGYTPTASFTAPYNTILSSNVGVVTWTFNMRQIRTDPSGFSTVNSYGVAFALSGTSNSMATAGDGYAVVLGQSGTTDPVRLAKYTLGLQGTITDMITSNTLGLTDFGAEYLSVKVTYIPSTNTWELFLRNDGSSAFADPTTGTLTSQGISVDATYTGVGNGFLGGYWQGSTGVAQTAYFDNAKVTVTYPNTITTGAVTGAPFTLAACATPGPGFVAFTSTDIFNVGNTFTAQLSDDIGSFTAPINIGSIPLDGTNPSGNIPIIIPAGTVSGTGYLIRVVSDMPVVTGSSSAPFTVTQVGYCASSHTDYYRTIASGDWDVLATWESSPDGLVWITPATLAPTFNAKTILIRNTYTVTIAAAASADELTVQLGGTLIHSNGVGFTLNDGSSTDMIIQSGGTYVLNGSQPAGTGTVDVQSGALIRVDGNSAPGESDDFAYGGVVSVTFNTGSVYEWNTNTFTPSWTGRTYFTNGQNTTFRFSQSPNFNLGGNSPTVIYGTLEANAPIVITGGVIGTPSDKTFTHGILGTGNIDASAVVGDLIINAAAASLGGSGTLTTPSTASYYLRINNSIVTMTSSKIVTGDVQFSGTSKIILGNFDLTVSGTISGYGLTTYVQTDGTGYLKMNAIGGSRVFPVGFSNLNAVYINNGGGSDYSVRVENGINPGVTLPTYAINRTWNIFASALTPGVEVTFWYYTADANPGVIPGTDLMEVLLYSGAAWSITPGNVLITPTGSNPWLVTTVNPAGNLTINTTPVPYIVGKNGGWVLPIDCIISTRAQKQNNTGIISWTVNSCSEVRSFEVQRSVNNSGFQTIGIVNPVVNQTDFNFTDASLAGGRNLYRIKVNGFASGSSKYSNTVVLIHNSNDILISSLVPNPVHDKAMLTVSSGRNASIDFKIYNASGNLVKQWSSAVAEGNNTIEVNAAGFAAGVYTVFASSNESKTISRFVKQ